jgi:hypothetical protein
MDPKFCHRYPELCEQQKLYDYISQFGNGLSFPHAGVKKHTGVIPHTGRTKHPGIGSAGYSIANKRLISHLKSQRVGKLSKDFPSKLEDLMRGVGERNVSGFKTELKGEKFNVSINPKTKEMRINFQGAGENEANVMRIVKNQPISGTDVTEERQFLKDLGLKNGKATYEGVTYDVKLVGHSYGGYKARLYGAETNTPSEVFNGHIMPWNNFPKTEAPVRYHTIINDPTDFKFLERLDPNVSHTYYHPLTPESQALAKEIVGTSPEPSILDPHYAVAWEDLDRSTQNDIITAIKTKYPELGVGALALAPSIYAAATDPNYNPQTDPMLGNLNETGPLGVNLDPNYQWSDTAPPTGGLDWLIWKTLSPLAKSIASPTNPAQAEAESKRIEKLGNQGDLAPVQTFTYNGDEYYYRGSTSAPVWYSVNGAPLSQDIKDAFNAHENTQGQDALPDFTEMPF